MTTDSIPSGKCRLENLATCVRNVKDIIAEPATQ